MDDQPPTPPGAGSTAGSSPGPIAVPVHIRWLALLYLVGLIGLAIAWSDRHFLADPLDGVPLGVVWLGAIGAVLRSLDGIFWHGAKGWRHSYDWWHVCSPVVGAATAVVGYVLVRAGAATVGSATKDTEAFGYLAVAFLVGYSNEDFRRLVARAGHSLFGAPATGISNDGPGVQPNPDHTPSAPDDPSKNSPGA
jgi:hypothetical protein